VVIAALFTSPSVDEWIKEMLYTYTMEPLRRTKLCLCRNMDRIEDYYVK
jgi:hypothetical protein